MNLCQFTVATVAQKNITDVTILLTKVNQLVANLTFIFKLHYFQLKY